MERRNEKATEEEALAIRVTLMMAKIAGWTKIEVQSDCKFVMEPNQCKQCLFKTLVLQAMFKTLVLQQ